MESLDFFEIFFIIGLVVIFILLLYLCYCAKYIKIYLFNLDHMERENQNWIVKNMQRDIDNDLQLKYIGENTKLILEELKLRN